MSVIGRIVHPNLSQGWGYPFIAHIFEETKELIVPRGGSPKVHLTCSVTLSFFFSFFLPQSMWQSHRHLRDQGCFLDLLLLLPVVVVDCRVWIPVGNLDTRVSQFQHLTELINAWEALERHGGP